jgi:hypothetical protein
MSIRLRDTGVGRPFGAWIAPAHQPNVETLGYYQSSLRDGRIRGICPVVKETDRHGSSDRPEWSWHPAGGVPELCHPCRGGWGMGCRRSGGVAPAFARRIMARQVGLWRGESLDHRLPSGKPPACVSGGQQFRHKSQGLFDRRGLLSPAPSSKGGVGGGEEAREVREAKARGDNAGSSSPGQHFRRNTP